MNILVFRQPFKLWRKFFVKLYTTQSASTVDLNKVKHSYDNVIHQRQLEAKRSLVVQVSSEKSFPELYNYCKNFGNIIGAHHYRVQHDDDLHYILLEFSTQVEAAGAIDSSAYNEESNGVPVRSPFLWFRATKKLKKSNIPISAALNSIEGIRTFNDSELSAILRSANNVEHQIRLLHQHTQLNDIGIRLRFLAAYQVQQALSGMFPDATAQPFGSSVNGFGKMGCDLDLILRFDREIVEIDRHRSDSRLVFHTKDNLTSGRSQVQRQMESIGDMLQLFLPGVSHVRRILQARVPIIKYYHEHLNLEVDLSMSNLTGFYMSELLYMFGELDDRVRPLIFCIRKWAQACGLTNPSPGRWISNFGLTCLVIFFLQQMKKPILPTINALMKSATPADVRITEDGINCTFGRDIQAIGFNSKNQSEIHHLLLLFFEYYSQFDFQNRAISLNEGRTMNKPDHSALYIVNPLEQVLNVSKNVSSEECERLRIEVRNAAWTLESEIETHSLSENERNECSWGLENLLKTNEQAILRPNMFFQRRMVEVSDLFDKTNTSDIDKKDVSTGVNPTSYKNQEIKKRVENLTNQRRNDLKQIRFNTVSATSTMSATMSNTTGTKRRKNR